MLIKCSSTHYACCLAAKRPCVVVSKGFGFLCTLAWCCCSMALQSIGQITQTFILIRSSCGRKKMHSYTVRQREGVAYSNCLSLPPCGPVRLLQTLTTSFTSISRHTYTVMCEALSIACMPKASLVTELHLNSLFPDETPRTDPGLVVRRR